jgi:hypothetical protein
MSGRWGSIVIAVASASLYAAGARDVAGYLLLLAIPAIAISGLAAFGELLDATEREPPMVLDALLPALALLLLVAGAAAGSIAFALSACLAVFGVQAMLGLGVELRSPAVLER